MKISYEFADGVHTEVEVSEELGAFILDTRKEEERLARKARRYCYSSDAAVYEGEDYADKDTPYSIFERNEQNEQLCEALSQLTDTQSRRLLSSAFFIPIIPPLRGM